VKLLVIDECHYATGKHNYATILNEYYHPLAKEQRPRVLGLTASPLINVKINNVMNDVRLQYLLAELERVMDARLFGFPSELEEKAGGSHVGGKKVADESIVVYNSTLDEFDTTLPSLQWPVHQSRVKELDQLQHLCNEVGLAVTAVYTATILKEIAQNEFEHETTLQFENLKLHLSLIVSHLNQLINEDKAGPHGGHTNKMRKLEELLLNAVATPSSSETEEQQPVGIVFVERRMMVIALCNYFCHKRKQIDHESHHPYSSIRCDVVVRQATQVFKYLNRNRTHVDPRIQAKADEEWVHQTKRIRSIIMKLRCRETNVLMATSVVEEGIDVEACSFIASFDGLKTVKSYIQMKGRARQKDAVS